MPTDIADAHSDPHDAMPPGWFVGRPSSDEGRRVGAVRVRPAQRTEADVRSREWTAVAHTELEVIREMARCLRLIREGRVPE